SNSADFRVLPLLLVGFATYQLDRTNLSSAITGGLADDLSINQNTINLGNQLMFLGVILLEIPSNVILFKIGPRWWIAGQVFVFGTIAAMQVFIRNKAGFLSTRTLLGLAEAGYIPGAMFILSTWYTKAEITKRVAIFFFGMFGGTAISPLLGAGLLKLEGKGGLRGWQWIFLAEGVWSVAISLLLLVLLPPRTSYTTMVEEESKPTSGSSMEATDRELPLAEVWRVLTNTRRWPHFLATACVFATWSPLTTYTPSIIMSLGFSRVDANALAAVGCTLTLPVVYFFAWLSDKTKKRGIIVILAITVYLIALVVLRVVQPYSGRWSKFSLWTAVNGVAVGYHPIHNAWIQINCRTPEERNISLACLVVMSATSGLMGGSQLFRQDESSRYYPRGLLIMIGLVVMGLIFTATQELIYLVESRDAKRRSTTEGFLCKGMLMERSGLTT
ncbi:putative transporter, partial [Penicillium rolfsii]